MRDKILTAKSMHVFACPFDFGTEDEKIKKFIKEAKDSGWQKKEMSIAQNGTLENRENFMRYQYFGVSARNIFYNKDENAPCTVFTYGDTSKYTYYIRVGQKSYELEIGEIEMHLYDCGVGVLLLRLLNHTYEKLEQIRDINDFGRRISLPFVPESAEDFILCADEIGILKKDNAKEGAKATAPELRKVCVTNFRDLIKEKSDLTRSAAFLEHIVLHDLEHPRKQLGEEVGFYSDDRMYLLSLIRDDALSAQIKEMDEAAQTLLYQLIYVDNSGELSCPNAEMRKELLEKASYKRWSSWGTLYAVTSYSMLCLTSTYEGINESVVRPFIVEYSYMFSLVLAQKFCISKFSDRAGKEVNHIEKKDLIKTKKAKKLANLQEEYVAFKNKLLILQVTPQEQGVELYQLLQKQFFIAEEQAVLDEQLQSLYEIVNTSNGNRLNKIAFIFSIIAIGIEIFCSWGPNLFEVIGNMVRMIGK